MAIDLPASTTGQPQHNGLADQLRNRASNVLSHQKHRAAEGLGTIANAVRHTGRQLGDTNQSSIAGYVNNAADSLQRWVDTMERKDIRDIVEDIQRFGRRQPALFIGLSLGAGLLGARFLKSSGKTDERYPYRDTSSSYRERDSYTAPRTTPAIRDTTFGGSTGPLNLR